jgi:predicted SprT family Zn-dependent metalloprotease
MIRTYPEIQQVMRRIEAIVRKYIPDAEVKIVPSDTFYAATYIPSLHSKGKKVVMGFSQMLVENGTWEQIEDTVAHEIAHVMSADRHDKSAADSGWHTEDWGDITRALGGSGGMDYYPDVLFPPRYKYRCADCGYTTNASEGQHGMPATSPGEISVLSPGVARHGMETGHHKWYVLDELTGKRFTVVI